MNTSCQRILIAAAALGLVVQSLAQPAPRSYSRYFFFGDSLTDSGNTFALTGSPPAPYFQGRVSNGPTYAEYVAPGLANAATTASTPARLNFAYAGATAAPGSAVPHLGAQIAMFQARGVTAGADDLFVILAGANDVLNTVANPATQNGPAARAAGAGAAAAVTSAVNTLTAAGARNIVVLNLPDISRTARFITGTGAPAASLAQDGSYSFNEEIKARLSATTNVTLVDLGALFSGIIDKAATFGLTNVRQEYLGILQAGGNPGDVGGYLFWDGIHPTTKTHAILATALTEALNPEFVLGTAAVQGTAVLHATDAATDAIGGRLAATRRPGRRAEASAYAGYLYKDGGKDYSGYAPAFDYTASVLTVGVDYPLRENLLVGGAFTRDTLEAKLGAGGGSFDLSGDMVTGYVQWRPGSLSVEGMMGFGGYDLSDISRKTAFGGIATTARGTGSRTTAALRLAMDMDGGGWRFAPFAGIRYTRAGLDAYAEKGVNGLNFSFDGQTAQSFDGVIGGTAEWQVGSLKLELGAAYQRELDSSTRTVSGRLANTVARTSRIAVEDGLAKAVKLNAALRGDLGKKWQWSAGYLAEIRDDGATASQYAVVLGSGF